MIWLCGVWSEFWSWCGMRWREQNSMNLKTLLVILCNFDTEVISNVTARITQLYYLSGELGSCSIRLCGCQHWTNAKLYQMSLEDLASHIDHGPWNITHTQQYGFELKQTTSPDCLERTLQREKTYCFLVWLTYQFPQNQYCSLW